MNLLIDIGHPAHVHYFKHLYHRMKCTHNITVTCKSVDIIKQLLIANDIPFIELGTKGVSLIGKMQKQICFNQHIRKIIIDRKIDIAMGVSLSVIYASRFTKAESIFFIDDDQAVVKLIAKYAAPYADTILSPDVLKHESTRNCIYYPGYQELAYLHPYVFKPNKNILSKYNISENDNYFLLRFTALKAHHDIKARGLSVAQKQALIDLLQKHGRVFVTIENDQEPGFAKYTLPIEPHEIHDFLYYARMLVSDSQTMSTEASVLGVPSFRCNTFAGRITLLEEEEKRYGLTFGYYPQQFDWMLDRIKQLLALPDLKSTWSRKRDYLLADKISVTDFWCWFIKNFPESKKALKDPKFDFFRFK